MLNSSSYIHKSSITFHFTIILKKRERVGCVQWRGVWHGLGPGHRGCPVRMRVSASRVPGSGPCGQWHVHLRLCWGDTWQHLVSGGPALLLPLLLVWVRGGGGCLSPASVLVTRPLLLLHHPHPRDHPQSRHRHPRHPHPGAMLLQCEVSQQGCLLTGKTLPRKF